MADEKNKSDANPQDPGKKSKKAITQVSEQFQKELFAFIQKRKESGNSVKNKDELIMLFLNETRKKNTTLYKQYTTYITDISGETNINTVTFAHLQDLPISKNGKLSEIFAQRHGENFEEKKQATVFDIRKEHYTKAIGASTDKKLQEKRHTLCKTRLGTEKTKKLIAAHNLLPSLQKTFDAFFKEQCTEDEQRIIGSYLADEDHRPTIKTYLNAFATSGDDIDLKNRHVKAALLDNAKKDGKTTYGVRSLDKSMAELTQFSLLESGIVAWEGKSALVETFDNTFSHTDITKGIFKDLPRTTYISEKKPTEAFSEIYQQRIAGTKDEIIVGQIRKAYEKQLLDGYLDRANETIQKKGDKTPKATLLEQLATVSKLDAEAFGSQKKALTTTISSYLKDEYLANQLDKELIQEQFKQFGIDQKHFPAYIDFWKQLYDLENNTAVFKVGEKEFVLYADKKLITTPEKFTSVDALDRLFSFERTIDFEKSDEIFGTLFGNTPKAYIVDDTTGKILDTANYQHEISIYLDTPPTLQNRLLIDTKSKISITDTETGTVYSGYPRIIDAHDDEEIPHESFDGIHQESLVLVDEEGKEISPKIQFASNPGSPPKYKAQRVIASKQYTLHAHTRTFSQPATPPLVTQLIQTAVFNEMAGENNKIPVKNIHEQVDLLSELYPHTPHVEGYLNNSGDEDFDFLQGEAQSDTEISQEQEKKLAKFASYKFSSTKDIPDGVIKECASRIPPRGLHEIKAWIDQGEIFFHTDYFCKTYAFQDIQWKDNTLTFINLDGTQQTSKDVYKNPRIRGCLQEIISAKTHEITHRLLHFHDIHTITYTSTKGNIDIDQETLCEIADGKSLPRKHELQADGTKRRFITLEKNGIQHHIRLDELEDQLEKKVAGFSRAGIKCLDAKHLEEYEKDYEKFADLLVANTANPPTPAPIPPTVQTVNNGRQAMSNRLKKFIKQLDENYDPSNQEQVTQRATAQQHLDTLTQQEQALNAGTPPTQDELDQMHQAQVDSAQFLQEHRPQQSQNQRGNQPREQGTNTRPSTTTQTGDGTNTEENTNEQEQVPTDEQESNTGVSEEERQKFAAGFAEFKGDLSAPLEVGSVIFLKENISDIPGRGFNRVKYTIKDLTEESIFFELSDASEKNVTKKTVIERPRTESTINELKKIGKGEVYKFGKEVATKGGFMRSIQNTVGGRRADVDNFKKTIQDDNSSKKEEVTHVGNLKEKIVNTDRSESIIYKVDRGVNSVTVSSAVPDGNKDDQKKKALRTKRMDYDTFQMFCFTKGLDPLTKTEVTRSGNRLNSDEIVSEGLPKQSISLAAIRKGLQAIPETYKKKFEEEQEFQAALATDYISNYIPNTSLFFLDEIKNDLGGTDGLVWQRIQKFKSEWAATGDSDKASIHDIPIAENIKANVFENIQSTRKYKYKAGAALLYALEKGGPYFRGLAEYANKDGGGRWVKCLLGEEARKQFVKERQRKIDQYKSAGGSSDSLQSEIVKLELQFIENGTKDKPGRGSKFGREIEGHKDTLYGGAQSLDPSGFSKKGDFPYMYDAFRGGGIGQNLPWVLMSSLEAMKGAVEEGADYNQFYMCIMMIFATGMVHMLPKDYLDKLKGIGRSRGIPITLLAGDAHASGKAMRILDHIARKAGIKTFSEFSGHSLSMFDGMHIHNYESDRTKIRNSFANRWSNHGRTMMDAFNYKNDYLIDLDDENQSTDEKKTTGIVKDYLGPGGVFGGYKGIQDNDSVGAIDGQSPFFQEGVLNLSEGSFRSYMMKFNQGQLINEHSASMWSNFAGILDQFETNIKNSSNKNAKHEIAKLLYKKFIKFFDQELGGTAGITEPESRRGESYKDLLKAAIKGEVDLEKLVRKSVFKEKDRVDKKTEEVYVTHETISNGMVKDTILKFANLVKLSYAGLDAGQKADIFSE